MGRKWRRDRKNKHNKNNKGEGGRTNNDGNNQDDRNRKDNKSGNNNQNDIKNNNKEPRERDPYEMIRHGNYKMEVYYALQGLHDLCYNEESKQFETTTNKEAERQKWLTSMKTILPASFRIGNDIDQSLQLSLKQEIQSMVGTPMEILMEPKGGNRREFNKQEQPKKVIVEPIQTIDFIPNAFQLNLDRQTIRRNVKLQEFHEWLKIQTNAGFVSRQETVSMIPPIVLDIKSTDTVLDMCAAPGSKTSQLLEIVNLPAKAGDVEPTGCVVANDNDEKRAYMLVHQLRRINSSALFITCCDAQFFPLTSAATIKKQQPQQEEEEGKDTMIVDQQDLEKNSNNNDTAKNVSVAETQSQPFPTKSLFQFDCILCDVPCAGDGTARKNPGVWKKWTTMNGLGLHTLQIQILQRGIHLCAVGGKVCYSTCSMNPIENEAVVYTILKNFGDKIKLVNMHEKLNYHTNKFIARKGMMHWKVFIEKSGLSKRQEKNIANKNNEKMKRKRQQWQQKQEKNQEHQNNNDNVKTDDQTEEKEEGEKNNDDNKEVTNNIANDDTAAAVHTASSTDNTPITQKRETNLSRKFEPTSWDKEYLEQCLDTAGLMEYTSFENVPEKLRKRLKSSCFPSPNPESDSNAQELQKCIRCLPQDMNTGGFFVALFQKVAPTNTKQEKEQQQQQQQQQEEEQDDNDDEEEKDNKGGDESKLKTVNDDEINDDVPEEMEQNNDDQPETKRPKIDEKESGNNKTETERAVNDEHVNDNDGGDNDDDDNNNDDDDDDEVVRGHLKSNYLPIGDGKKKHASLGKDDFIPVPDEIIDPVIDYYGLHACDKRQFMIRACGDAKAIYFIGKPIKNLIDQGIQSRVTVVNSGLKAFARNSKKVEADVKYRLAQEGVHFIAPHMSLNQRKLVVESIQDFKTCLSAPTVKLDHESLSSEFVSQMRNLSMGSFVVVLKGYGNDYIKKLIIAMWKCRGDAVNCLVNKAEIDGMYSKLRALEWMQQQEKQGEENEASEEPSPGNNEKTMSTGSNNNNIISKDNRESATVPMEDS